MRDNDGANCKVRPWVKANRRTALTGARNADFVAANDDDLLSSKQLFRYNTTQPTQEMVATVDNLWTRQHHSLQFCWYHAEELRLPASESNLQLLLGLFFQAGRPDFSNAGK